MKIADILAYIDYGRIALPEFQRGYVWNREQVRSLFESLYRRHADRGVGAGAQSPPLRCSSLRCEIGGVPATQLQGVRWTTLPSGRWMIQLALAGSISLQ